MAYCAAAARATVTSVSPVESETRWRWKKLVVFDGALKTLFKGAQLTTDAERELNAGIKKALSYYGTPHRVDLVSETPKGPVVVKFIYTQSFDSLPLSWSFFAYRNSHGWVIISAQFSDKTDLLQ